MTGGIGAGSGGVSAVIGLSVDADSAARCPFVRAVAEGRLADAAQLALAGLDPADGGTVPVLVEWARQVLADGKITFR